MTDDDIRLLLWRASKHVSMPKVRQFLTLEYPMDGQFQARLDELLEDPEWQVAVTLAQLEVES